MDVSTRFSSHHVIGLFDILVYNLWFSHSAIGPTSTFKISVLVLYEPCDKVALNEK